MGYAANTRMKLASIGATLLDHEAMKTMKVAFKFT
jgi:hypothetical protein